MYRIAIEKLIEWKNSNRRKPLIVEGARLAVTVEQGEQEVYLWSGETGCKGKGIRDCSAMAH